MSSRTVAAALQAVIFTGNWDYAGELADEANFVDCMRCFAAPRLLTFDDESQIFYMHLFCASCWYAHIKHQSESQHVRRWPMAQCPECDIIGIISRSVNARHVG